MTTNILVISTETGFRKKIVQLFIFSASMALLESAVVVYLRALYYPEGFTVALRLIADTILFTEILREAATLIMLAAIAAVAGKTHVQRFAYFLFCFAIWDIFYYIWLKVLINWPESLFTWDILFLIPVTWLGPVLAPVLCSLAMIVLAYVLLSIQEKNWDMHLKITDWLLMITGSCLILYTFIVDYATIILSNGWAGEMDQLMKNEKFIQITSTYIPSFYNWPVFFCGLGLILSSVYLIWKRENKLKPGYAVINNFNIF